jgi:tetratricopeptide (TPR) repeat protein
MEASGDRIAEWASRNAVLILGAIAAVLVVAGGVGLYAQHGQDKRDEAADALALATSRYRQAMGADPVGGPVPEPANAELAEETRSEYVERFMEVARSHAGTVPAALAWLEAGHLQVQLGRLEAAAESFGRVREEAAGTPIAAMGAMRLAGLAEDRGDPKTAAEAYEAAAAIDGYPLRASALSDAARCWVDAGDPQRAIAAFQRLENEFPDEPVSPPVQALIAELRVTR